MKNNINIWGEKKQPVQQKRGKGMYEVSSRKFGGETRDLTESSRRYHIRQHVALD